MRRETVNQFTVKQNHHEVHEAVPGVSGGQPGVCVLPAISADREDQEASSRAATTTTTTTTTSLVCKCAVNLKLH